MRLLLSRNNLTLTANGLIEVEHDHEIFISMYRIIERKKVLIEFLLLK